MYFAFRWMILTKDVAIIVVFIQILPALFMSSVKESLTCFSEVHCGSVAHSALVWEAFAAYLHMSVSMIQILLAPSSPTKWNLNLGYRALQPLSCQTLITRHFSRKHLRCFPLLCLCPHFSYASSPFPPISPSENPPSEYSSASPEVSMIHN